MISGHGPSLASSSFSLSKSQIDYDDGIEMEDEFRSIRRASVVRVRGEQFSCLLAMLHNQRP